LGFVNLGGANPTGSVSDIVGDEILNVLDESAFSFFCCAESGGGGGRTAICKGLLASEEPVTVVAFTATAGGEEGTDTTGDAFA
jgi:hypothetical protein